MPNPKFVVEAKNLKKIYKDFWGRAKAVGVSGIDLEVRQGEVLGLLGPNGSGKTTTIKLILGLLKPLSGSLKVFDQSPDNLAIKRKIGYLPEETCLYNFLTAQETLEFIAALFGLPHSERRQRANQLLDMVGLTHASHRRVGEFSKGMIRRIGLAQALINDPDLIILDEPTSGLDPLGCLEVKNIIRLLSERNKTVIISSHLLADMEDICDKVLIMYGGKILTQGLLKDLLKEKGKTQITTPILEPRILEKIKELLVSSKFSPKDLVFDQPSKSLEEFFLEVLKKAAKQKLNTSGVKEAGSIANYLRKNDSEEKSPEQILQIWNNHEHKKENFTERGEPDKMHNPPPTPDLMHLKNLKVGSEQSKKPSPEVN